MIKITQAGLALAGAPLEVDRQLSLDTVTEALFVATGKATYIRDAVNNVYVLAQSCVPTILLSSATNISAGGLITGLTALPYNPTAFGLVQVYMFARAGLAAGFYWARFTSTTSCQLFTDATGATPLSGITSGAYAGGTTAVTLASIPVPGGALGNDGMLRSNIELGYPNNANTKTFTRAFGGSTLITNNRTTTSHDSFTERLKNRGVQAVNSFFTQSESSASFTTTYVITTVDTSQTQNFNITAQLAVATDYAILDSYCIELLPQP